MISQITGQEFNNPKKCIKDTNSNFGCVCTECSKKAINALYSIYLDKKMLERYPPMVYNNKNPIPKTNKLSWYKKLKKIIKNHNNNI